MGLLTVGVPLDWATTKEHAAFVRREGVLQFIRQYHKLSKSSGAALYWGDEIEYTLVHIDPITKKVGLVLMSAELLPFLQWEENRFPASTCINFLWRPEYAAYMVEGTPGRPFGHLTEYLNTVEFNMQKRREQVQKRLPDNFYIVCLTTYPRLGCPDFTYPPTKATPNAGASGSLFYPDDAINSSHPRFRTLTRNIRERRGSKVAINLPIFRDNNTPKPFIEDLSSYHDGSDPSATRDALPEHVYLDAMGFGMGCCCLQVTFQGCCISEARMLYDQLTTVCPMLMALSASTPAIRGYLLDVDCRWGIISGAVDDRTEEERGLKPLKEDRFVIPKSRYDSVSSFISPEGGPYNDTDIPYDKDLFLEMQSAGIDDILARHIAHLFIRDPIVVYKEKLNTLDEDDTDHFENIQSTNWQSMRFKPPPPNSDIGWRVEFRPMELQLTDFENAAFATFVVLLTRTILTLKLNFLIPISKVEENMRNAVKRDAVNQEKFHFRRADLIFAGKNMEDAAAACRRIRESHQLDEDAGNDDVEEEEEEEEVGCCRSPVYDDVDGTVTFMAGGDVHQPPAPASPNSPLRKASTASGGGSDRAAAARTDCCGVPPDNCYTSMTINEIINGNNSFPGLIALIRQYLSMSEIEPNTAFSIHQYLSFISKRASGELPTAARWLRYMIQRHPDYHGDSVVSQRVTDDLISECLTVSNGPGGTTDLLLHGMSTSRTRSGPPNAVLSAEASLNLKRNAQSNSTNTSYMTYAAVGCSSDHC